MYKYNLIENTKGDFMFQVNKRPTEAGRRPTAEQLQTEDSISLGLIFVMGLFLVIAIGGEQLVRLFA